MTASIPELLVTGLGAAGTAAIIVYGLIRARTDWVTGTATREKAAREEVTELLGIKDEMIAALREQNQQAAGREAKSAEREAKWNAERDEYKAKLEAMDGAFQNVVFAMVNAGICARASTCKDYAAPGERRNGSRRS